jgi:DNA-binding IclR family transcriptional regulator
MSKIVGRTLDFLEVFADQKRPLSLSEIARLLEIPASSCHDVIQALQERGYIYELAPRGGYYPTLRIFEVAKIIAAYDPVVLRADSALRSLRDAMDESVLLSKVQGMQAAYLLALEPGHPLRFLVRVGDPVRSLYATSAGKALLGSLGEPALSAYLKALTIERLTPNTIASKAALRAELEEGNRRGWFLNREQSQEGVTTLSGRFVWSSVIYIVTIAGPTSRMEPKLHRAAEALTQACRQLELPPPPRPND